MKPKTTRTIVKIVCGFLALLMILSAAYSIIIQLI